MSCAFRTTLVRARAEGLARPSVHRQRSSLLCFRRIVQRPHSRTEGSSRLHHGARAGASPDAVSNSGSRRGRKYSILHDFCMQIPYGSFIVLSGLVLGIRGPLAAGILLGLVGMAVLLCARASLMAWKLGRPSTTYTVMSTMATAYLTWIFGLKFKMMLVKVDVWGPLLLKPAFLLFILSAAITLFQIYNVWAGGNPPKVAKSAA